MPESEVIKNMLSHIKGECSQIDVDGAFDDMLDDCYSFKEVGGPFAGMSPSRVLRLCDETAHRCGVSDYADGQRDVWIEIDEDYYDKSEAEKAKDEFIDWLRDELNTLSDNWTEAESARAINEDATENLRFDADVLTAKNAVESKKAEIDECEKHAW